MLEKMKSLYAEVEIANKEYYLSYKPRLSDREYDEKKRELAQLAQEHPEIAASLNVQELLDYVGAPIDTNLYNVMIHVPPMQSLDNSYNDETLEKWGKKAQNAGSRSFVTTPKYDGLAWENIHRGGVLEDAGTRGNGTEGESLLATALHADSIPTKIPDTRMIQTRGEMQLSWENLEIAKEIDGKEYKNPRNAAAGIARRQKVGPSTKLLDFVVYDVLVDGNRLDSFTASMELVRSLGFTPAEYIVAGSIEELVASVAEVEKSRAGHKYMIDGAVSRVEETSVYDALGFVKHHPHGAIASKFEAEQKETRMNAVEWTRGKKGKISPNARLETLHLAGTDVSNALLHNQEHIDTLDIRIGDMVYVEKSAEIIPQVVGVNKDLRDGSEVKVIAPTHCPVCQIPVVAVGKNIYCKNEDCGDTGKNKLLTYVASIGFKGIGPKTAANVADLGHFQSIPDFYKLTVEQLISAGVAPKNAPKLVDSIKDTIGKTKPQNVLAGFSIEMCGEGTAEDLVVDAELKISEMINKDVEWFSSIQNIGTKTAEPLSKWFSNPTNISIVNELYEMGVLVDTETKSTLAGETQGTQNGALTGLVICVTGTLTKGTRNQYKELIEENGGKFSKDVVKGVNILLAGDKVGEKKMKAAIDGNLPIWTEDDFHNKIGI